MTITVIPENEGLVTESLKPPTTEAYPPEDDELEFGPIISIVLDAG